METNVNYTIVGAFVILLTTAIVFAIIWLSSGFSFAEYNTYLISMKESVSGLNVDSPVEFNGVEVGNVETIEINKKNPQHVDVLLNIRDTTPITQGTVATLATRGVTGFTYVALKDNGTDLKPLVALPGQSYAVIKTAPSLFLRIDTALSQLSTNFQKISDSIQELLNKNNQQSIRLTLKNLQEVTAMLAHSNQKFNIILDNTARVSHDLIPFVQSSASMMRTLEVQTLPTFYRTLNNLDNVTRNLSAISNELQRNPALLIRGKANLPPGPGEKR